MVVGSVWMDNAQDGKAVMGHWWTEEQLWLRKEKQREDMLARLKKKKIAQGNKSSAKKG